MERAGDAILAEHEAPAHALRIGGGPVGNRAVRRTTRDPPLPLSRSRRGFYGTHQGMTAWRWGLKRTVGRAASALLGGATLAVLAPQQAEAVPVFARKYETSCQTCHVAFPKLNPAGEAFRRNGFRFPSPEDEDARREEPIALGHDAHRRLFPDAVWPGTLPSVPPLAFRLSSEMVVDPDRETPFSFDGLGGAVEIIATSTLGSTFSAWFGARIVADADGADLELERAFVVVQAPWGPSLQFRIGRFEPALLALTSHRTLGLVPWVYRSPIHDNEFTLGPAQSGLEMRGVLGAGRLAYAVGLVEGRGNLANLAKDVYARVEYKLGGMRLDGVGGATDPDPWAETAARVGLFGYTGRASLGDPVGRRQVDPFFRAGIDLELSLSDAQLLVAVVYGENNRPRLDDPTDIVPSWHILSQLDYVVFPWLIPTLRYEHRGIGPTSEERFSGGAYVLVQANIRLHVLAVVLGSRFHQARAGLDVAF